MVALEIIIQDAEENEQYHLWRATDASGVCRIHVPVGALAPTGNWRVTARELLSGMISTPVAIAVPERSLPVVMEVSDAALVFDGPAITAWLTSLRGKTLWIALDTAQEALREEAAALATALRARGIAADVIEIAALDEVKVNLNYAMSEEQVDAFDAVKAGNKVGMREVNDDFKVPGPQRIIMRPLMLLGNPAENRWLADINTNQLFRRPYLPNYPGAGRALLQYTWSPFYDGFDVVTIMAQDAEGLRAGIMRLLALQ